jgi:hypothetical protein
MPNQIALTPSLLSPLRAKKPLSRSNYIVKSRWCLRQLALIQYVGSVPFVGIKHKFRFPDSTRITTQILEIDLALYFEKSENLTGRIFIFHGIECHSQFLSNQEV